MKLEVLKSAMLWTLAIFGGIASCMAVVSAVVSLIEVGVHRFLNELLKDYRELFAPIRELFRALGITVDQIYLDAASLYLIGVVISKRLSKGIRHVEQVMDAPDPLRHSRAAILFPYNLRLMSRAISWRVHIGLAAKHGPRGSNSRVRHRALVDSLDKTLTSIVLVPIGMLGFFVWNAFV